MRNTDGPMAFCNYKIDISKLLMALAIMQNTILCCRLFTESGRKQSPTTKLALQLTPTAIEVAIGRPP